jgi:hypothetical protein
MTALSSATTSGAIAMKFAGSSASPSAKGVVFEIHGATGLPIRDHSKYPEEKEITLSKDHQYRVTGHGPTEHPHVTRVVLERIK